MSVRYKDPDTGEWVNAGSVRGPAGKSAYEYAKDGGFTGTEAEFARQLNNRMPTDEIYFDITADGVISLKPEYRGACPSDKENYTYGLSDNSKNLDGSQNKELPEEIIIPETVNGIAVTAYAYAMFIGNKRVKRVVLCPSIKEIPGYMFYGTWNLQEVEGLETVETLNTYAFSLSGILSAKFPALKTMNGDCHFRRCGNLTVVDLGNTITEIPKQCFEICEKLVEIRNTQSVTKIGVNGLHCTLRLKKVPFLPNVTEISTGGLLISRADFSKINPNCIESEMATAKAFCGADYWSACNFTPCNTPLRSTFNQHDPGWVDNKIGNTERTWDTACLLTCAAMAYSILEGKDLSSPEEFTDAVYAARPSLKDVDTGNIIDGIERYLEAVDYDAVRYTEFNTTNLQAMYDALADGALVINRCIADVKNGNHDVLIHGINADGEVLCVDPAAPASAAMGKYEAISYAMPIQNRNRAAEGTDKDWVWIVRKKTA